MKEPVIRERSSCHWCRLRGLDRRGASHSPSSSLSLVQGRGRGPAEAQWQGRCPACPGHSQQRGVSAGLQSRAAVSPVRRLHSSGVRLKPVLVRHYDDPGRGLSRPRSPDGARRGPGCWAAAQKRSLPEPPCSLTADWSPGGWGGDGQRGPQVHVGFMPHPYP